MSNPWAEQDVRREPFFKLPGVILLLLTLMAAVHVVLMLSSPAFQQFAVTTFGFVPEHYSDVSDSDRGVAELAWPFVTHAFLHGNLAHLIFNALWLMAVGTPLARRLGTLPFLVFYLLCGAISAGAHLLAHPGSSIPVVGASGAIAGCMAGALRVIFSSTTRYFVSKTVGLGRLAPLRDARILTVTAVWVLINLAMGAGLMPMPGQGDAGIAWEAHIGGFVAGLVLIGLFDRWAGGSTRDYPTL
jgi:membrane associated rhomboid family serine protease